MHSRLYRGLDVLGSLGILEGVPRLLKGSTGRADVGNHHRPARAYESILQQSSQLAVPEVDVVGSAVSPQGIDAVAQG